MKAKAFTIILIILAVAGLSAAELEFRTQSPIDSYADIDMNGNMVGNLSAPVYGSDAVTVNYASYFLNRTGDTMSGDLRFDGANINLGGNFLSNDSDSEGLKVDNQGNVLVPNASLSVGNGSISVEGTTDTVDLDNPGNAITLNGNQYLIAQGAIGANELDNDSVTASGGELDPSIADNQLVLVNGKLGVQEGAGSGLDADLLDGVQLGNIDWSHVEMQRSDVSPGDVDLATLTPGTGISGNGYDGTTARTWSVDWSPADDLDGSGNVVDFDQANDLDGNGNVIWGNAGGLDSNGVPNDFSNAGDLGSNGDILDGHVENAELANSALTVAGNSVSLGGSTSINHGEISNIGSSDHHIRPSAGTLLSEDASNNFNVQESSISHDSISGVSANDHHSQYSEITVQDTGTNIQTSPSNLDYRNALSVSNPTGSQVDIGVNEGDISHDNIGDVSSSDHHTKTTDTNAGTQCSNSQSIYLDGSGNCQDLSTNTASYINGDLIASNSVDSSEIDVSTISHDNIGGVSYNDHHGLGDDLTWDSNNNPRLGNNIDVDTASVSTSFKFPVGTDAY